MPRKNNSELTKQKVIKVATEIFMTKGYENTTMQDIVNGVGMSSGAIFHHYKSKKEILDGVISSQEVWMTELFYKWLDEMTDLPARDKIINILDRHLEASINANLEEVYLGLNQSPQIVVSQMCSNVNNNAKYIAKLLQEGVKDGSITTENPDECAQVFMLLYNTWTDPNIIHCGIDELENRMVYLQSLMRNMGADIITDENIKKNVKLYRDLLK
jgi:TetR/AcrR family acrAB operon transcriptional repressor